VETISAAFFLINNTSLRLPPRQWQAGGRACPPLAGRGPRGGRQSGRTIAFTFHFFCAIIAVVFVFMGIKEAIQRQAAEERENIHDFSFREAKKEPIFFDPKEELGDFEWQEIERFLFTNAPGELLNIAKLLKAYKTILQDDFELAKVPKQFIDRIKAIVEVDRLRQQQIEFPISTVWRLLEEHLEIIDFLSATERARILNHDIEEECSEDLKKEIERGKDKANLSWAMGMARNCRTSRRAFPRLVEKIDKDVVQRVIQEINEEIKSKKGKGVTEVIRLCDLIADFRQAFPEKIKKIILSDETKEWMIR